MKATPLVSVVMITYAHENYIRQAIAGVLMQECNFELELIIANDCSPDNTDAVIKDILNNHPKAHWIKYIQHKENKGMMPNFIFALGQAKADYIALCDGDDYWTDPLKLQKQVDFLEENEEFSMCFHDAWVVHGEDKKSLYVNQERSVFTTEDLFKRHFIPTASIVFRNNIQLPIWLSKIASGDRLLLFLLSLKGKIKYIKEEMAIYRLHEGGISNTHSGIKKIYDTALLLHLFDESTDYKFTKDCHDSLHYEIKTHLKSSIQSNKISVHDLDDVTFKLLLKILLFRVKKKFYKIFK